jgi:hypothetical protein
MFTFVAELSNKSRLLYFLGGWTWLFTFIVVNIFCMVLKSSLLLFGSDWDKILKSCYWFGEIDTDGYYFGDSAKKSSSYFLWGTLSTFFYTLEEVFYSY